MVFREGPARLTRAEVMLAGRQILARFNEEGAGVLKDPEVRKTLAASDGLWTVGGYLVQLKSGNGLQRLKLEFAKDPEILRISVQDHAWGSNSPVGFWLAYHGNEAVHLELLKNEEALRITSTWGRIVDQIHQKGTPRVKELAERFVLGELLRRSGELEPREIRHIARALRTLIRAHGVSVLENEVVRPYLFASMSNGWTVAHRLAYERYKEKNAVMMHFAGDAELLAIVTDSSSGRGITLESELRDAGIPGINKRIDETLGKLKRG